MGLSAGLSYAHSKGLEMSRESHNNSFSLAGGGGQNSPNIPLCVIFTASKVKVMLPHVLCHTAGNVIIDP